MTISNLPISNLLGTNLKRSLSSYLKYGKFDMLTINGAYGEGGGQIIRTTLALSVILTQPVRIINIRAKRKNPGLMAQHLTGVNAAAMICDATLTGNQLGSTELTFEPQSLPVAGDYAFDVAESREGGSAGAATLVLQTIVLPLALASGSSQVTVKGGTHVPWSPSFHYYNEVFLPMLRRVGFESRASLLAWGWYPAGEGELFVEICGSSTPDTGQWPMERGALQRVSGLAVASSLPAYIAQRMANRAINLLSDAGLPHAIQPQRVRSTSPGAGIFLTAEYESGAAGFTALGRKGKSSEHVAEEAVESLLAFHRSRALLDVHLADQMILPLALSGFCGPVSVQKISQHTLTNLWVVEQFLGPVAQINAKKKIIDFIERDAYARP